MRIKHLILFFLISFAFSCVGPKYSIEGTYTYKNYPKAKLEIGADGRFEYIDLASIEFQNLDSLRVMRTSGSWEIDSLQYVRLNSVDSIIVQSSEIRKKTINNFDYSIFTFFDIDGDTVQVNYQINNDGTVTTGLGKYQFSYWKAELEPNDSLVVNCSEYGLWSFVKQDTLQYNIDVLLYPEYRSNYFNNYPLKIRRGKLFNIERDQKLIKE